jgi:hypothetical protein
MASAWIAAFASHDSTGTLFINTFGVKMDPVSGSGLNANDLAGAVNDWFGAEYRACLGAGLTLDTITVRKMPEPTTEEGAHAIGLAGGVAEGPAFPKQIAVILSWKTDQPGRSGRGHIALPAPRTNAIWNGTNWDFTTTYFTTQIANLKSKLDACHDWMSGGVTDGHLSHVVYSRKHDAYYDVKTRITRPQPRWVERRQTAP